MIRERQIQTGTFTAGALQSLELPKDAVYHMIQLSVRGGTFASTNGDSGAGITLDENFPFSIFRNIRLIRNGSDVVWQGSGAQLAKEHLFLNKSHPFARLFTTSNNAETLRTATVRGVTIPANTTGIGACEAQFTVASGDSANTSVTFDFLMELWLQLGVDDLYYGTLVDARKLASYILELQYAAVTDISVAGTNSTGSITATINVSSYDQDNLDTKEPYGTFKRSAQSLSNIPYNSANQQILLPRGNYFFGIIFEVLGQKTSATVLRHESGTLTQINNRINSNYTLRAVTFKDLASKHLADGPIDSPHHGAGSTPQGWAFLNYPMAGRRGAELVPTYAMDQFDLQITTAASTGAENVANSASTNPTINLLMQEVIPGVDVGKTAPRGAFAGSRRATSAKPYAG